LNLKQLLGIGDFKNNEKKSFEDESVRKYIDLCDIHKMMLNRWASLHAFSKAGYIQLMGAICPLHDEYHFITFNEINNVSSLIVHLRKHGEMYSLLKKIMMKQFH
jgi:hypothetical protein